MNRLRRDAVGIGLRAAHYRDFLTGEPEVEYVEVITENFLGPAGVPARVLERVAARCPVVLHGVGLNLLGPDPLDEAYLDSVCRLADRIDAPYVSDHLCWTGAGARSHHDLLPSPFLPELVSRAAERAHHVQRRLGRPFGLENLSSYVAFRESSMTEWAFYASVVREAGCHFMLDVNNIWVSGTNHGFAPQHYLDAIDFTRVLQVHVAGHDASGPIVVDTHDRTVSESVWQLLVEAWRRGGPFPVLLERDARVPPLPALLAEAQRARSLR